MILCGVEFFIFGGSLLGRIQSNREPVSFFVQIHFSNWFNFPMNSLAHLLQIFVQIPFQLFLNFV